MIPHQIEAAFTQQLSASVQLYADGTGRYRVSVPFMFDDGDTLVIFLKNMGGGQWVLSDEGHTYMHLAHSVDAERRQYGTRRQMITRALRMFQVQERGGELVLPIDYDDYAEALWNFVQAILKIIDVTYLSQERVRSTFLEDFKTFFEETIAPERRTFDWYDAKHDPEKHYMVDCRINGLTRPLFIYALTNNDRVRDATIGMAYFARAGFLFYSVGIFEDQTTINRRVLARLTDICDRQFSSLSANREPIQKFLIDALSGTLPAPNHEEQYPPERKDAQALLFSTGN